MTSPPPSNWRFAVCGLLLLATTLNYMDRVALNLLSKRITTAFQLSDRDYGLLESVFSVAFAIGTLTTGWLVDRFGVRWIYPLAVAGWSLAGFATGFANSYAYLLICRFTLGLFEAGNWPCGVRTVRQVMPPEQRSFGNSLFQSGTAIGAIITPMVILLCFKVLGTERDDIWRWPFAIIGLLGFAWVVAWAMIPRRLTDTPSDTVVSTSKYADIFRDRRFYILIAVIVGVNWGWHTIRIWLPKYLDRVHHYSEIEVQQFSILYYVAADIGAWTVGLATWLLASRFTQLHTARVITFGVCTVLLLATVFLPLAHGSFLVVLLLTVGFAALGLFPTYFALSQELSATHQGKVTGTLGFINAMVMAGMSFVQGEWIVASGSMNGVLATAAVPAVFAFVMTLMYWNTRPAASDERT